MSKVQQVTVELDVPAPMRDGTLLRANLYRPAGEGRHPVLLTRLPYGKDLALGTSVIDPLVAVRRGYAVMVQDTRGRFKSEGDFYPYRAEAEDGFDTIAWAAAQPWSDGQVGMYGASYFGQTQWLAAAQQPPALRAMVPYVTFNDNFHGHGFRAGAFELGMVANWILGMSFDTAVRRHAGDPAAIGRLFHALARELDSLASDGFAELPLKDFGPLRRAGMSLNFFDAIEHAMDREYSASHALSARHDQVTVPTFNIGGWYDCFLHDTLLNYRAMRALGRPAKLLVGPWSHGRNLNPVGEVSFGFGAQAALIDLRVDFYSLQLRWFDHWMKGLDTGMLSEPPVKIFVQGSNHWRDEDDWPLARAVQTPFHLRAGGVLSRDRPDAGEPPDCFDYDPADPVPTLGGATLMSPEFPSGPHDQRRIEGRADVLTFTSAPLEREVEVTGPITLALWAATSAPDTDWVGRLCDVHPDGRSMNLTDGVLRARYRNFDSGGDQELIEPGRPYHYRVDLWATSNLFKAGHRIRLQITSSSFPRWDRNPNTGRPLGADSDLAVARQTIFHDAERPSHVVLPIVEN